MEQKQNILTVLNQTPSSQIPALPMVGNKFQDLFRVTNGGDAALSKAKYETEKFFFMKLIAEKKDLQACTKLSLYGVFLDVAASGLSLDPTMKHGYIVGYNHNVGTKDKPVWEKRASWLVSGPGELIMRVRQGQLLYADNPIRVYEGDHFRFGTRNDKVFIEHESVIPRKTDNIIACYIKLTRPDGSVDYKVLSYEDVMKLREFSKDKNSLAWTAGIGGMIESKTIKHAFRGWPKVRLGSFSQAHSNVVEQEPDGPEIDYGFDISQDAQVDHGASPAAGSLENCSTPEPAKTPAQPATKPPVAQNPVDDDSFTRSPETGNGVVVDDDNF